MLPQLRWIKRNPTSCSCRPPIGRCRICSSRHRVSGPDSPRPVFRNSLPRFRVKRQGCAPSKVWQQKSRRPAARPRAPANVTPAPRAAVRRSCPPRRLPQHPGSGPTEPPALREPPAPNGGQPGPCRAPARAPIVLARDSEPRRRACSTMERRSAVQRNHRPRQRCPFPIRRHAHASRWPGSLR